MSKKIIVLSGKQFSGKDTVAKMLLDLMPDFKRVGLGDAIKIEYGKRKGLTFEEIETNKSQYRPDLIALGDEGRAIDPDFWLKNIVNLDYNVMVPDIRVPHELKVFKDNDAISIRVEATREARAKRGELVKEDDPTETALDGITDWDFAIDNSAGYEELKDLAKQLAKEIQAKFAV